MNWIQINFHANIHLNYASICASLATPTKLQQKTVPLIWQEKQFSKGFVPKCKWNHLLPENSTHSADWATLGCPEKLKCGKVIENEADFFKSNESLLACLAVPENCCLLPKIYYLCCMLPPDSTTLDADSLSSKHLEDTCARDLLVIWNQI